MTDIMDIVNGTTSSVGHTVTTFDPNQYIAQALNNQFLQGLILAGILGAIFYALKGVAFRLFTLIKRQMTTEVTVKSGNDAFDFLLVAFTQSNFESKSRRFQVKHLEKFSFKTDHSASWLSFYPGDGLHIIWFKGSPLFIKKETSEAKGSYVPETFIITGGRWSLSNIKAFINMGKTEYEGKNEGLLKVGEWISGWRYVYKNPRPMSSVFTNGDIEKELVNDMQWFKDNREWYVDHGILFHRGYLLHGPPGTGKTSLALALASHFNIPLMTVNLGSVSTDRDLKEIFYEAGSGTIILLEDVDACSMTHARSDDLTFVTGMENDSDDDDDSVSSGSQFGPTLSGLLNILDGVTSNEDRIVIMTTNDPSKLDSALVRPGRVDRKFYVGYQDDETRGKVYDHFFGGSSVSVSRPEFINDTDGMSPADVQQHVMDICSKENV